MIFCKQLLVHADMPGRLNAELSKQVRDLQQEAIELRADNARSSTAHANTYQQLQECLAEVDRLRMCQSQAEQLRQALHLITHTAEHAASLLPPDSQATQQQQQKRNKGPLANDIGSSRPTTACSYTDSMASDPDADTILPTSASLRANHIDNREPLISSKPDLSLIHEASQEESFHHHQLLQSSSSRGHHQWSDIPEPPALLPPSVAVTRPRRSSSAASLRPSLDECVPHLRHRSSHVTQKGLLLCVCSGSMKSLSDHLPHLLRDLQPSL